MVHIHIQTIVCVKSAERINRCEQCACSISHNEQKNKDLNLNIIAYQKNHKKYVEVKSIEFEGSKIIAITVKNPDNTAPRIVTYSQDSDRFWLYDSTGECVLELSIRI